MSRAVQVAVDQVADRVSAAAGVVSRPGVPESFRMEGVSPDVVSRRILSGLVEVEELAPLLAHIEKRVQMLVGTLAGEVGEDMWGPVWVRRGASFFMSEVQCVAVGLLLARGRENSGGGRAANDHDDEGPCFCGCGRVPTVGPPAFVSAARAYAPAHGGFPGFVV